MPLSCTCSSGMGISNMQTQDVATNTAICAPVVLICSPLPPTPSPLPLPLPHPVISLLCQLLNANGFLLSVHFFYFHRADLQTSVICKKTVILCIKKISPQEITAMTPPITATLMFSSTSGLMPLMRCVYGIALGDTNQERLEDNTEEKHCHIRVKTTEDARSAKGVFIPSFNKGFSLFFS